MTRWHDPDCRSPDVFVDDGNLPTCRACGRVCPSTASLVASLNITPSGVDLPPDEEYGQMNLWWPRDVLYVNQRDPALCTTQDLAGSSAVANIGESLAGVTMDHDLSDQTNSHIYGNTLKSNEFRLACLSAVPREDYPVHLSLETHTYDNRPEYETVSYTWGGESGDSRPSRPVYVGQYWDVILQSHNCWAMLQFARPWRGIRMLWVDALCMWQSRIFSLGNVLKRDGRLMVLWTNLYNYQKHHILITM